MEVGTVPLDSHVQQGELERIFQLQEFSAPCSTWEVLSRALKRRLLVEALILEEQSNFCPGCGILDQFFILSLILEGVREFWILWICRGVNKCDQRCFRQAVPV